MADIEKVLDGLYGLRSDLKIMCAGIHRDYYNNGMIHLNEAIQTIRELQNQIPKWHLVADGELPKEHDSMFAKYKGTNMWNSHMFEKISDDVFIAVKDKEDRYVTYVAHTVDGKWKCDWGRVYPCFKVIAWTELLKFEGVE